MSESVKSEPRSLTAGEAANYLGVSMASLRRWCADGVGPAYWRTPGGSRRFKIAALDQWMREREEKP